MDNIFNTIFEGQESISLGFDRQMNEILKEREDSEKKEGKKTKINRIAGKITISPWEMSSNEIRGKIADWKNQAHKIKDKINSKKYAQLKKKIVFYTEFLNDCKDDPKIHVKKTKKGCKR